MSSFYSNAFGERQAGNMSDRVVGIGNTVTSQSQNQQHHYYNADYISDADEEKWVFIEWKQIKNIYMPYNSWNNNSITKNWLTLWNHKLISPKWYLNIS